MVVISFIGTMLFIFGMAVADSRSLWPTIIMMSVGLAMMYIGARDEKN